MQQERINVVGPCSGETQEIVQDTIKLAKSNSDVITGVRFGPYKPHTIAGGFYGAGIKGQEWIVDAVKDTNLWVDMEAMLPDHVTSLASIIARTSGLDLVQWCVRIGSRNQNDLIQTEIARRTKVEMPKGTKLTIKNQPWKSQRHWLGIVTHTTPYVDPVDTILIYRGTDPGDGNPNPRGLRNLVDWEWAMKVKEESGLQMWNDPSHEGGTIGLMMAMYAESLSYAFDGNLIEGHPLPSSALTDRDQQPALNLVSNLIRSKL